MVEFLFFVCAFVDEKLAQTREFLTLYRHDHHRHHHHHHREARERIGTNKQ